MALCRSGGCHENGRHEVPSDSIMESIMESLATSVTKMLLGEHIAQQALLLGHDSALHRRRRRATVENFGWDPFWVRLGITVLITAACNCKFLTVFSHRWAVAGP